MANKRIIELQERTSIDMGDWLIVDSSTSTRKLSLATLFNYMTYSSMIFVTELPTTDISTTTIYLVPHSGSTTDWDEYIYRENEWVLIGTSTIDLSAIYQTNDKATIQNNDIPWYGTSSTTAATAAKIATTTDRNLGALAAGQKVTIKFTYANTASNPTLNVDSKGAKSIKAYGTTAPTVWWNAGDVVTFTYDGTNWIMGATTGQIQQLKSDLSALNDEVDAMKIKYIQHDGLTTDANGNINLSDLKFANSAVINVSTNLVNVMVTPWLNGTSWNYHLEYVYANGGVVANVSNISIGIVYISK